MPVMIYPPKDGGPVTIDVVFDDGTVLSSMFDGVDIALVPRTTKSETAFSDITAAYAAALSGCAISDGWAEETAGEIDALIERRVAAAIEKAAPQIIEAAAKRSLGAVENAANRNSDFARTVARHA